MGQKGDFICATVDIAAVAAIVAFFAVVAVFIVIVLITMIVMTVLALLPVVKVVGVVAEVAVVAVAGIVATSPAGPFSHIVFTRGSAISTAAAGGFLLMTPNFRRRTSVTAVTEPALCSCRGCWACWPQRAASECWQIHVASGMRPLLHIGHDMARS